MRKGFLIYEEMRKYLTIYEEAAHKNLKTLTKSVAGQYTALTGWT